MFIVNDDFSLSYGDFTIFNMAASAVLNFRNLEFMSRGLHGHASLLPCANFIDTEQSAVELRP